MQNVAPKPTHRAAKILNPTRSDFKYPSDFGKSVGFRICHIRSNRSLGTSAMKSRGNVWDFHSA